MQTNFDELKKCGARKENLHTMREEQSALQRDNDELVCLESRMKMISDEESGIQKAHLISTQEIDSLRSEHEELKIKYDELKSECSTLKGKLNDIRKKCDVLQRDKDELVGLEGRMKVVLDEESGILKAHMILNQERDTWRSENEELKHNRGCSDREENLNAVREKSDSVQRDRNNLVDLGDRMNMLPDEQSNIQIVLLMLTQLKDILRSQHEGLKVDSDELKQQISTLNENWNVFREHCDALQRGKHERVSLEERINIIVSSIEKAHLIVTQEKHGLRSEQEEFQVYSNDIKRRSTDLKENLNDVREEHDDIRRVRNKLVGLEDRMKVMSDENSSIQKAHLLVTQERDNLRSKLEEKEIKFHELSQECLTLKETLNAFREERDALQMDKDKSVGLEDGNKMAFNEKSSIQKAHLIINQERDNLRSELEEHEIKFDELNREYLSLKKNLNAITEERDALQREKQTLVGLEDRMKMALAEKSRIEEANLKVIQERDALKSERDAMGNRLDEANRECLALTENLNAIRENRDDLQADEKRLILLEGTLEMILHEDSCNRKVHLKVIQERDALRSKRDELESNLDTLQNKFDALQIKFDELSRECLVLEENLNATSEERDALQRVKGLDGRLKKIINEKSVIQKALSIVIQERNALRSELEEQEIKFYELNRECLSQKQSLNIIREERDALLRDKQTLGVLEDRMKIVLSEKSSTEEANLIVIQERDTLRSERDELERNLDGLKREYIALQENLNAVREELKALQKGKDKILSHKQSGNKKVHCILTQERNTLSSEQNKVEVKFDRIDGMFSSLKGSLKASIIECKALQMNNIKLLGLEGRRSMMYELLRIRKAPSQ
jgi:chromosome segregation ATPase